MTTLKESAHRSVRIEGDVVVKRFRHAGRLGRLLDRRRALREHSALQRLTEAGVPVPRPLGVRPDGDGWSVEMERVRGVVPLEEVLAGRSEWPAPPERVMAALGRSLAGLLRAGVDHPDLHPGNALIDPGGRPVLVDFHHARLGVTPRESHVEAALARACAWGRERTSPRMRARFLLAFLRALPELGKEWRGRAAELERLGRRLRRARNLREADRWTRESSLVRKLVLDGPGEVLARRRLEPAEAARLLAAQEPEVLPFPGPRRTLLAHWTTAGRLFEHAIPVTEPLVLAQGLAVMSLPPGAVELDGEPRARALEDLEALLLDRGLALPAGHTALLFAAADGSPLLAPPQGLVPVG